MLSGIPPESSSRELAPCWDDDCAPSGQRGQQTCSSTLKPLRVLLYSCQPTKHSQHHPSHCPLEECPARSVFCRVRCLQLHGCKVLVMKPGSAIDVQALQPVGVRRVKFSCREAVNAKQGTAASCR